MGVSELAERCEAATGPDRKLDCEIEAAIGKMKGEFRVVEPPFYDPERYFSKPEGAVDWIGYDLLNNAPRHTASLDAAMGLVPKEMDWLVRNDEDEKFAHVTSRDFQAHMTVCGGETFNTSTGASYPAHAATAALALCAAALRANAAIADTHPKDGDAKQAPLVSGGGAESNRPDNGPQSPDNIKG